MMLVGLSPIIFPLGRTTALYLTIITLTGFFWSPLASSLMNYLLDRLPTQDLPSYLAWYNLTLYLAILIGSLGGPILAEQIGMTSALILFGVSRFAAGLAVLRWG
jgi:predicted MFS family arabinose efflux permease